jgi:hypothetical protein
MLYSIQNKTRATSKQNALFLLVQRPGKYSSCGTHNGHWGTVLALSAMLLTKLSTCLLFVYVLCRHSEWSIDLSEWLTNVQVFFFTAKLFPANKVSTFHKERLQSQTSIQEQKIQVATHHVLSKCFLHGFTHSDGICVCLVQIQICSCKSNHTVHIPHCIKNRNYFLCIFMKYLPSETYFKLEVVPIVSLGYTFFTCQHQNTQ